MRHHELWYEGEADRIGQYDARDLATFTGRSLDSVLAVMSRAFSLTAGQRAKLRKDWRVELKGRAVEYLEITPSAAENPWFGTGATRQEWEAMPEGQVVVNVPPGLRAVSA
jgi:hypothetical protein